MFTVVKSTTTPSKTPRRKTHAKGRLATMQRRGPGRPRRPDLPHLSNQSLLAALRDLLKVRQARGKTAQRYWDLTYVTEPDKAPEAPVKRGRKALAAEPIDPAKSEPVGCKVQRQVSVHEAMSKLRRIEQLVGPVEDWMRLVGALDAVPSDGPLPIPQRAAVERIVVTIGRSERPRSAQGSSYSWRKLDAELFRVVLDAELRGERFALLPMPAELQKRMGVGVRAIQKSLERIRTEIREQPGLYVHIDLWIGEPPEGDPGMKMPRYWASRYGTCRPEEAAARGLLPVHTTEQLEASRRVVWDRLKSAA